MEEGKWCNRRKEAQREKRNRGKDGRKETEGEAQGEEDELWRKEGIVSGKEGEKERVVGETEVRRRKHKIKWQKI